MRLRTTELLALRGLRPDGQVLLLTRVVRMFAYGFLAVILALYFTELGWENGQIGALLTITLAGNAFVTLAITTRADRIGRKKMLIFAAVLMLAAGITLLLTDNFIILAIAGIVGTISPTGLEVGAFAPIEQAALPQSTTDKQRTKVFAWYNLFGFFSTALGSLIGGVLSSVLQSNGVLALNSYRVVIIAYLAACLLLIWIYSWLSPMMEAPRRRLLDVSALGLHISRGKIYRLAGLYALDAFAGGLVVQSLFAYWFKANFGADEALIGLIFFMGNVLAGISTLGAARLAKRLGLLRTMVWSQIPAAIFMMLIPFMPHIALAILLFLLRASVAQMDMPTRQSYLVAIVQPDERSAAAGVTNIARTFGTSLSPALSGILLGASLLTLPFLLSGVLKIGYNAALYRFFKGEVPPEEVKAPTQSAIIPRE